MAKWIPTRSINHSLESAWNVKPWSQGTNDIPNNQTLTEAIECLATNHWQIYSELSPDHKVYKAYSLIRLIMLRLANDPDRNSWDNINKIISKQYRPTVIKPGTVGAFLFGCFQETHGDVGSVCSPLCIDSIYPVNGIAPDCDNQVWMQYTSEGYNRFLRYRSPPDSRKAYIFVESTFNGFTSDEIVRLAKNNILMGQIMTTRGSKHYTLVRMTELSKLPLKDTNKDRSSSRNNQQGNDGLLTNVSSNYGLVMIFILVGIIVVMIILFFYSTNDKTKKSI